MTDPGEPQEYVPTEMARSVLEARYLLKDENRRIIETPKQMFHRVARAVAQADRLYGADDEAVQKTESEFYRAMSDLEFLPNSPTLMNAGAELGQLSACFVLPVDDSIEGITGALREMAIIMKSGGGVGFSFSRLRHQGALVKSSKGEASGPVSFMRVYDVLNDVIKQGGKRRGAMMGMLRVDHPDIASFIRAKTDAGELRNFNISVAVTDGFMEAVRTDGSYDLRDPRNGAVVSHVRAREVWDLLVNGAWLNGEPGLGFIDRVNKGNPTPQLGALESSNPCVTGDTWVMTSRGPRQVRQVVGRRTTLLLDGKAVDTAGFFRTGNKRVYHLRTREGYALRLTENHMVAAIKGGKTTWTPVSELHEGSQVVLARQTWAEHLWPGPFSEQDGYLLAVWMGDGSWYNGAPCIYLYGKARGVDGTREAVVQAGAELRRSDKESTREIYLSERLTRVAAALVLAKRKEASRRLEAASGSFYLGFLRGFFDTDGCCQGTQAKGVSLRLSQSDLGLIQTAQRMLHRLGIPSVIYRDGHGGLKDCHCRANHELVVSGEALRVFSSVIGLRNTFKAGRLSTLLAGYRRAPNAKGWKATVESVTEEGTESVYDVRVPGMNRFDANGVLVHNCGEAYLLANESCNLASINLARMVSGGALDENRLLRVAALAVHFLDNVIEVNKWPLEAIEKATKLTRKIGLGVMGWAELLIQLGIPYDSEEALTLASTVMGLISKGTSAESMSLARVRGPYPAFSVSVHACGLPRRNAMLTLIAPNGSIGIIAGVTGGIEPIFCVALRRRNILDGSKEFYILHPLFEKMAREGGWYSDDLARRVSEAVSLQDVAGIPEEVRRLFRTAFDVSPARHVAVQAEFQKHVDNAISKTINLPRSATRKDVEDAFLLAFELGCKGVTVYRDGSREAQPLATAKTDEPVAVSGGYITPRKRPKRVPGHTWKLETGCGSIFVTITQDEQGKPMELFAKAGKAGVCSQAQCEAIGRLASLALRSRVDPKQIAKQLGGITCHVQVGMGPNRILSCADAIAKALLGEIESESQPTEGRHDDTRGVIGQGACPECGAALASVGSCAYCAACGYTRCS